MNDSNKQSGSIMKTFAVVGFLAIIAAMVWLAVAVVSVLPSAFSSLASIADTVYNNQRPLTELTVANENSIINHSESFTISWTDLKREGSYTFMYECTEGVTLTVDYPRNEATEVACATALPLDGETFAVDVTVTSSKNRFTDVSYTIGFIPTNTDVNSVSKSAVFTIVNATIPQSVSISDTPVTDTTDDENSDTPTTGGPYIVGEPEVTYTEIYEIPESDPKGFVDLAVRYLGVGRMTADNVFIPGGTIDQDTRGAFQFEVKNLGTKTSDDWDFTATMTSGKTYTSATQDGLKPNERIVITLGFDNVGATGAQSFGAEIDIDGDINASNDSFSWAVNIVD